MTHQQKLELQQIISDMNIEIAQRPGFKIGFANGHAGYTAVDASERRPVYGMLSVSDIDDTIDDLLRAREHLMNNQKTATNWEIPKP